MLLLLSERKVCLSETEQPGSRKRGSVNCGGGTLIAAVAIYVSGKVPTCVAEYWVTWRFSLGSPIGYRRPSVVRHVNDAGLRNSSDW